MSARPDPGAGVFETLLVRDGRPVELDAHLERLAASLRELYATELPDGARRMVLAEARGAELARLRLDVAPNGGRRARCAVRTAAVDPALVFPGRARAPRLRALEIAGGLGAHKWADRRLVEGAEGDPGVVPLVVDRDGTVLEASRGNVFLVLDGALVTPPADGRILPGVTRHRVLELARDAGLRVRERAVSPADLRAATEVFLTGAVRGVEPVRAGGGGPPRDEGPVVAGLAARLRRLWRGD